MNELYYDILYHFTQFRATFGEDGRVVGGGMSSRGANDFLMNDGTC